MAKTKDSLVVLAEEFLVRAKAQGLKLTTAESCTGGLIAAAVCSVPGSSAVFDRGFVTYSNEAKVEMLGVEGGLIAQYGAVSAEVALAMAEGALKRSHADLAISVTGIAGPDGGTKSKPVGLVYLAAARKGGDRMYVEKRFGDVGRQAVRTASAVAAFALVERLF